MMTQSTRPGAGNLINIALSLPATLVWVPTCLVFLSTFGYVTIRGPSRDLPPVVAGKVLSISLGSVVLCIGGLVGIVGLWTLIGFRDEVRAAGGVPVLLLRSALWIGFITCLAALALAGGVLWQSGFNLFIHSLFITVLGPIAVFLREVRGLKSPHPTMGAPG